MKIDIKEISVIKLGPGDVLVIKIKPRTGPFKYARADSDSFEEERTKMLAEVFPNNKIIFAESGDTFEIIKQKAIDGKTNSKG